MHLGCKRLHTANDQLECTLQRLGLGALVTLGFDVRNALTQSCHTRLAFLRFTQALGLAIEEPRQALTELAPLAFPGCTLLPLPWTIGVEATGKLLDQPCGMGQEGTPCLPHRQREAIRPHWGVGTEAVATKAIGSRADTTGIGIGPGPTLPGAGPQGLAIAGLAAGLTWKQALQQIPCPPTRLAGMLAVFWPLLLHCGAHLGLDDGGHGHMKPGWRRPIIV
jgi:hypothetical protein